MNNQNNLNNQIDNKNNQQPINFGNSLLNNNFNSLNQTNNLNQNNQIIPELNSQKSGNTELTFNKIPEVNYTSIDSQNIINNNQQQSIINNNNNDNINLNENLIKSNIESNQENSSLNTNLMNNQPTYSNNLENKPKKNNKKILIIVLVVIGILIILPIAFTRILSIGYTSKTLNNTRSSAFVSNAKNYISHTRVLVGDNFSNYYLSCDDDEIKYISLAEIEENQKVPSPYGGVYQLGTKNNKLVDTIPNGSYIRIEVNSNTCKYQYSIYLTDGKYSVGTSYAPIIESELDVSDVK